MPKRIRKITRKSQHKCPLQLWHVLIDDPLPEGHPNYNSFQEFIGRSDWEEHRAEVLEYWIKNHPGSRPSHWWRWDAPGKPQAIPENQAAWLRRHGME